MRKVTQPDLSQRTVDVIAQFDQFGCYRVLNLDLLAAVTGGDSNIGANMVCAQTTNDLCAAPNVTCPGSSQGNALCVDTNGVCGGQSASDTRCVELNRVCT